MSERNGAVAASEQPVCVERTDEGKLRLVWGERGLPEKVRIYWSPNPQCAEGEAELLAEASGVTEWSFDDPSPGTRSYYYIMAEHGAALPAAERVLPADSVINFRDMGGYAAAGGRRVKWGKLYRSADLSRMTERDIDYARSLNIAWICDLRTDDEVRRSPSPRIGHETNEQLSLMASADPTRMAGLDGITVDMLAHMNRMMVGQIGLTARFFRRLLDQEGAPILFHCAAGKDRTGFAGAMILHALGVERADIARDYALTNRFAERFKAVMGTAHEPFASMLAGLPEEVLSAMMEARPSYMEAAFDEIDRRYGSFESYWTSGLGLGLEELDKLREHYLQ